MWTREKLDSDPFIRQVVADAEATKETVSAQFQETLTAEDVTDIRLESSSYSAVSREKEYHLSCKINGVPDTLVYTVSQHDDGEGFTIRSGQREEDDIWKKMPQPELEKLEAVLPGRWSLTTGANPLNTQPMQMPSKWCLWTINGPKI